MTSPATQWRVTNDAASASSASSGVVANSHTCCSLHVVTGKRGKHVTLGGLWLMTHGLSVGSEALDLSSQSSSLKPSDAVS